MARKARNTKISKELLTIPMATNLNWLNEYSIDKQISNNERSLLLQFISFNNFASKPLKNFEVEDVKSYTEMQINSDCSPASALNVIAQVKKLYEYLAKKYPTEFDSQFPIDINSLRSLYKAPKDKGRGLNLVQLSCIRDFIADKPKIRYVFELFFQLGIDKKDLVYCTPKYLHKNKEQWSFITPEYKKIELNDYMKNLLAEYEGTDFMENNKAMVNDYLSQITNHLRKSNVFYYNNDLNIYDIEKTRVGFFFTCPNCHKSFETFANNWVLAKTETDIEYHFVCKACKGDPKYADKSYK